jgi:hypothetical protein
MSTEDPEQSLRTGDSHSAPQSSGGAPGGGWQSSFFCSRCRFIDPFGIAVLLIGIRIAFLQKPWLPKFIRQRRISAPRLVKVLTGGIRFAKLMEKVVKPRMHFLHLGPGAVNLIGLGIVAGGLLPLLPLPIPFRNMVPAWAVVLLTAGMMWPKMP